MRTIRNQVSPQSAESWQRELLPRSSQADTRSPCLTSVAGTVCDSSLYNEGWKQNILEFAEK